MSAVIKRGFHYKVHTHLIPSRRNQFRPHIFRNPFLLISGGVLALLLVLTSLVGVEIQPQPELATEEVEQRIVDAINTVRAQEVELGPVTTNTRLREAAATKQAHMDSNNYWAHQSPDGTEPWVFIKNQHVSYAVASETLARGFDSPESVVQGWLDSPSHRQALLDKNHSQIGVSVVERGNGYEAVAFFIQPTSSIATNSGVLSDTTQTPSQAIFEVQPPQLSKIAAAIPGVGLATLISVMALSIMVSVLIIMRQHGAQTHHLKQRAFHELPELHLVLNVGIFLLLVGAVI